MGEKRKNTVRSIKWSDGPDVHVYVTCYPCYRQATRMSLKIYRAFFCAFLDAATRKKNPPRTNPTDDVSD